MSLNWNLTKVENHETKCFKIATYDDAWRGIKKGERVLNDVTYTLIFGTIAAGLRGITAANADKFWARISAYEKLYGAFIRGTNDKGEPVDEPLTYQDILDHIGLSTNVSDETDAKWAKRIITDNYIRETIYRARQSVKDKQEEQTV